MWTIRIHVIGRNFSVLVYGQYVTYLYGILQMFPDLHRILPLFGMLKIDQLVILFPDRNFLFQYLKIRNVDSILNHQTPEYFKTSEQVL